MKNNKKLFVLAAASLVLITTTLAGCSSQETKNTERWEQSTFAATTGPVKEFSMTSFTKILSGQYFPQYSLKEITVKKGDKVKIKITATSGMHDFNIDEFDVSAETPLNKETVVEFVADKAGTFIYYCSKPGHRKNGHWGTLIVIK